jgi:predicted short-subunit dehydrogenase-like oxidoreductase (DUF2520 family)
MRELERTAADFSPALPRRVVVVGRGRLGSAIAPALAAVGIDVAGPFGRDDAPPAARSADAVLLCVPDAAIADAAAEYAGVAPFVGHTSGATPVSVLGPADGFGLHPLQTFAEHGASFEGIGCAIGATTPRALTAADALARCLGMRPFVLDDADRPAYHAAASIASNFLVTLEAAAERVAAEAGLDRAALVPLVRQTVENWAALGPERALTGPVARGDEETIARQREAVVNAAPELEDLWDSLVAATRALSTVDRRLSTR